MWAIALAVVVVAINLASMASAGAWDPWETHYGEVARNILVRHDPIDLWWQAGNGGPDATAERTFWSKPALPFWLMALSMKIFGVGTSADPAEMVQPFWPEMAIRLPSLCAGLGSAALLGYAAWRQVSPRAGILTALALVTMPQWAIATRQALTDMIFVGPVVLAIAAWILAYGEPDRALRTRGRGRRRIPWDRAYLAFVVVFLAAAVAPLAVIHQHSFDPFTWKTIGTVPKHAAALKEIQVHMVVYWVLAVVVLLRSLRWTRRSQAWMGILYLAAGLSLLGKGMIGPGLVGAVVLVHLIVTGRWDLLRHCGLPTGIALFALASFPWHHAMVLFRGERWVNELIIQNNLARFGSGEQKQAVGSFAFYLETLGMAALPWVSVVPLALASAFRSFRRSATGGGADASSSDVDGAKAEAGPSDDGAKADAGSSDADVVKADAGPSEADVAKADAGPSDDGAKAEAGPSDDGAKADAGPSDDGAKADAGLSDTDGVKADAGSSEADGVKADAGPSDDGAKADAGPSDTAEPTPAFVDHAVARTPEEVRRTLHRFALLWLAVSLFAIGYSVTKYYHYLIPVLPPLALLIGLWLDEGLDRRSTPPRRAAVIVGALVGVAVLVAVTRDAFNSTAWLAHLTTYLYTGMWRTGGPAVDLLPYLVLPFGLGLLAWMAARRREALVAFVLSSLLGLGWVIVDYIPAASENWSQRSAMRVYFDQRGPEDRLVSWWFYYRGETWFSKGDVWVMKDVSRKGLGELFEEHSGRGASLWFITIEPHARRLKGQVPRELRDEIEVMYESFHYVLMRVRVP